MRRALALGLAGAALLLPATAQAEFDIVPGTPTIGVFDAGGEPFAWAGGHPDRLRVAIEFTTVGEEVEGNLKDVAFAFPPGFAGDPSAVPACPRRAFDGDAGCGPESQVGELKLRAAGAEGIGEVEQPIYSVEAAPGKLAVFGFKLLGKTPLTMQMRPGDFGLTFEQRDNIQILPVVGIEVELWGVPADHQEGTGIARRPLLTLPARCDRGPLSVAVEASTWQQPDRKLTASADTGVPLHGCGDLPFAPAMSFGLDEPSADAPTGVAVDIEMPQDEDADGRASAAIESVEIALPEGVSLSPGAVHGLETCSDAALALGSSVPAQCPPAAKVGTVELLAPQLGEPLRGTLYLGDQRAGERFRLFVVAEGRGVVAKFVGALRTDPLTGRITAALDRLPEVPFSHIGLRFDGGERALLATPLTCGRATATGSFERYGAPGAALSSDSAAVDQGSGGGSCAVPFSPRLTAGTTGDRAGRSSELTITLRRQSGEPLADRFGVVLPSGLSAAVGSIERCAQGAVVAGDCPVGSRVGTVVTEVGSGSSLAALSGDVYLTGPHRRAPFGLAMVLRADLGPFDLGAVVARAGLRIDPESGRVSVETDPLPRMIEGIPIRFRTIGLDIDRPGFIRTPTSCNEASVDALVRSATGAAAAVSTPYAVTGCERLRFAPRASMRLIGPRQMRRDGKPGLRIRVRSARGGTNLRSVDVALPESLRRNPAGLRSICARQDAREGRCPAASRVGTARGRTPLLGKPLDGPIHLVQPEGSGPPELWTILDAEGARFRVRSELRVRDGRMRTKLVGLPDMPLSELVMRLEGGKRGLVSLATDPCSRSERSQDARVAFEGQNRAYLIARAAVERRCPPPSKRAGAREKDGERGA